MKEKKITLKYRIERKLREKGPLRVIELTRLLNKEEGFTEVSRNTVNTMLYTVKKKFKKIGYGIFDLVDGCKIDVEHEILRKLTVLFFEYKQKLKNNNINSDPKLCGISFSDEELKIMEKYKRSK